MRFPSHKNFDVQNDAISCTDGSRGALHQLPRSWSLGSWMNLGAKREAFQVLSPLTLWLLLWSILLELKMVMLASTISFQYPFTAWFISLSFFPNPFFFKVRRVGKYTKAIITSSQLSIYISLFIDGFFCMALEEMYGGCKAMNKYLHPDSH